jgi:hypothetical protein
VAKRKSTHDSRLSLPWEHGENPFTALFSGRRVWPLLSLIALVAGTAGASVLGQTRADVLSTRATLSEVARAAHIFVRDVGRCPRGLAELVHPPKSGVQYLNENPRDAWGRSLYFRCSESEHAQIEVVSAGPSGSFLDDDNVM